MLEIIKHALRGETIEPEDQQRIDVMFVMIKLAGLEHQVTVAWSPMRYGFGFSNPNPMPWTAKVELALGEPYVQFACESADALCVKLNDFINDPMGFLKRRGK